MTVEHEKPTKVNWMHALLLYMKALWRLNCAQFIQYLMLNIFICNFIDLQSVSPYNPFLPVIKRVLMIIIEITQNALRKHTEWWWVRVDVKSVSWWVGRSGSESLMSCSKCREQIEHIVSQKDVLSCMPPVYICNLKSVFNRCSPLDLNPSFPTQLEFRLASSRSLYQWGR